MTSGIEALLFDFDGTIVDTELPSLLAWQEVYEEHGHELTVAEWSACVGTIGGFDPVTRLQELAGHSFADPGPWEDRRRARELELIEQQVLRPGVGSYLTRAEELGLRVAIVSSGGTDWIAAHLARVGRSEGWAAMHCADGDASRAKPLPCLYEEALEGLGIDAGAAIAFEDSPNGIRAAKAAGLFCVAVPNDVTRDLDLGDADIVLASFEDASLDEVLAAAERG